MYTHLNHSFFDDGRSALDYLEFRVFRGGSLRWWCGLNTCPQRRFCGFDSFQGLPEDWTVEKPQGCLHHQTPEIDDPRAQFVVGWFQRFRAFSSLTSHRLVVHNDSDLYSSTFVVPEMNAFMPPGTLVIFDEFYDVLHEYRALSDYAAAYMRKYKIVAATQGFNQVTVELI